MRSRWRSSAAAAIRAWPITGSTLADLQEQAGRVDDIDATLTAALRAALPPTPALLLTLGMRAVRHEDWTAATRAFEDAIALEPLTARDDDARLDAAALVYVLASERGDAGAMASARRVLGAAASATAAFWRAEALQAIAGRAIGGDGRSRAAHRAGAGARGHRRGEAEAAYAGVARRA